MNRNEPSSAAPNSDAPCPCHSGFGFAACCAPFIAGLGAAPTALALMRSRYTAYTLGTVDYIRNTWDPTTRPARIDSDPDTRWLGLKVLNTADGEAGDERGSVEFVARYKVGGRAHRIHETSRFRSENGRWLYVDGEVSRR